MPKVGRPKIEISRDLFEGLCRIQCTKAEIWNVLKVSEATLRRWVKRTYGVNENFDTVHEAMSHVGKMSLRRSMFKSAEGGNVQAQIFLAKNHLGMAEKIEVDHHIESEIEREIGRLAGLAASSETNLSGTAEGDTDTRLVN